MNHDYNERCDEIGGLNGLLATPSSTREIVKREGPRYTMCAIVVPWDAIYLTPIISLLASQHPASACSQSSWAHFHAEA